MKGRWFVADINVERKGPSIWPWVIGLLVLALLIWALVELFGDRGDPMVTDPVADTLIVDTPAVTPAPPPPVVAPDTPVLPDTPVVAPDTPAVGTAPPPP
jgi:hypothetical protein